jgi:hypothetical protein
VNHERPLGTEGLYSAAAIHASGRFCHAQVLAASVLVHGALILGQPARSGYRY